MPGISISTALNSGPILPISNLVPSTCRIGLRGRTRIRSNSPFLMVEAKEELKLATVHTTLKRMLKRNLVEVADFAKSGNVFGRCYQPTISLKEFEMNKLVDDFKQKQSKDITTSNLVAALLDEADHKVALEELDELEKMIQQKMEKLVNGKK